jgi:putative sigma-54 modulation protein
MKVEYQGRNAELSSRFREHAEPRISGLEHQFDRIAEVRVTLSLQRGWKTVEIMLEADGLLLRAEERSNDELASFDKALDKLERQLKRYRERVRDHSRTAARKLSAEEEAAARTAEAPAEAEEVLASEIRIVRTKTHPLKPMTPEEAALQMELLGHDFFLFFDAQSEQVELVYRRRDGGYGLIEPSLG